MGLGKEIEENKVRSNVEMFSRAAPEAISALTIKYVKLFEIFANTQQDITAEQAA